MEKKLIRKELFYFEGDKKISGKNPDMEGNCTSLWGDCSHLSGCCSGLYGDCTGLEGDCSHLSGCCSGLKGNCSDLRGYCTDIHGDCSLETQKRVRPRLLTVSQFALEHPAFSQSSLRHLIFDSSSNNFSSVIRRIGKRKILLDEQAFFTWVAQQQKGGQS